MAVSMKRKAEGSGPGGKRPMRDGARLAAGTNRRVNTVRVYVRVRPMKPNENSEREVVELMGGDPCQSLVFDPKVRESAFYFRGEVQTMRDINKRVKKNQVFEFDQVFSPVDSNQTVYDSTAKTIVPSILDGYNCSVFAYGATGAGKTYTMLGKEDSPGISFLMIKDLLENLDAHQGTLNINICVSYLEVYNEEVRDLLSPRNKKLELREESGGVTRVSGLRIVDITEPSQVYSLLEAGNKIRTQHPTDSNAESSRSHAVFQVGVRMTDKVSSKVKLAKLTMIDLAGSERGCATGFKGSHFKEGRAINQSLLALGNCINALADGLKYVPYRDSKLTRILKDSLGGNCQTIMIANLSPSHVSYEETYNTLKYASRARTIVTTSKQNTMEDNFSSSQYRQVINTLQSKLTLKENEMNEVLKWKQEFNSVMEQRLKIYTELAALDSQRKITEFRHKKTSTILSHYPPENHSKRLKQSMDAWGNRMEVLALRMKELEPTVKINKAEGKRLEESGVKLQDQATCSVIKELYKTLLDSWKHKVEAALMEVELKHRATMLQMMSWHEECHEQMRSKIVPFYESSYSLLKAYGRVPNSMEQEHEKVIETLQHARFVSWDKCDGDGDDPNEGAKTQNIQYYQRLSYPGAKELSDHPLHGSQTVVPAAGGLAWIRCTTPIKNSSVHHLRALNPASRTIANKGRSPCVKAMQHLISTMNKENPSKETTATKKLPNAQNNSVSRAKKRIPFKSSSLANVKTAV